MTLAPISERAICEIVRRLSRISTSDGFETAAGQRVFRARAALDRESLPAAVVWEDGEQVPNGSGASDAYDVTLTISVELHVLADQDDTGCQLGIAKADVKRAVLAKSKGALGDADGKIGAISYTGSRATPRQDGSQTESVTLTFAVAYREGYGNPYSAQLEAQR